MSLATADLPDELEALRVLARTCQDALKAAEAAVMFKALEIEKLKLEIARLRRMQFGRSSERIGRKIAQLELRLEELESSVAEDAAKADAEAPAPTDAPEPSERTKPKRKPLPPNLPRAEVVHQPADNGDCACPDCGGKMARLGGAGQGSACAASGSQCD